MAAVAYIVIQVLAGSYNKMLYQTLSESKSYSSGEGAPCWVADYLDKLITSSTKLEDNYGESAFVCHCCQAPEPGSDLPVSPVIKPAEISRKNIAADWKRFLI